MKVPTFLTKAETNILFQSVCVYGVDATIKIEKCNITGTQTIQVTMILTYVSVGINPVVDSTTDVQQKTKNVRSMITSNDMKILEASETFLLVIFEENLPRHTSSSTNFEPCSPVPFIFCSCCKFDTIRSVCWSHRKFEVEWICLFKYLNSTGQVFGYLVQSI